MKARTDSYIMTADPLSIGDMAQIQLVRKTVAASNKLAKQRAKYSGATPVLYRVCLKARLGKANPAYEAKYKQQWIKSIKLEDAQRIDVYVNERR